MQFEELKLRTPPSSSSSSTCYRSPFVVRIRWPQLQSWPCAGCLLRPRCSEVFEVLALRQGALLNCRAFRSSPNLTLLLRPPMARSAKSPASPLNTSSARSEIIPHSLIIAIEMPALFLFFVRVSIYCSSIHRLPSLSSFIDEYSSFQLHFLP